MPRKDKKQKVPEVEPPENTPEQSESEEEIYELSEDEVDNEIMNSMKFSENIRYHDDFNLCLEKIKSLKELLNEENASEKPTQLIIDSLAEKISEMIKELK